MEVFFARQPIFDRSRALVAYELLYRPRPEAQAAGSTSTETMSAQVLVDAILTTGLEVATAGVPAYINASRRMLVEGPLDLIDPQRIVVEVLEDVPPDSDVHAALVRLTAAGYRIALDDYEIDDPRASLLPLAKVLKLDVLNFERAAVANLAAAHRAFPGTLLAERVETEDAWRDCMDEGFQLFQGYFFQRPELIRQHDLNPGQIAIVTLMNAMMDADLSDRELEERFHSDVALSYKLLRMANSASVGIGSVESIGHALRVLGRQAVQRWLMLLLAASVPRETGTQSELLKAALIRARMCELIMQSRDRSRGSAAFLVGLLSRMDALLQMPTAELADRLRLAPESSAALLHGTGPLGAVLELADRYEHAAWDDVVRLTSANGPDASQLVARYTDAVSWAGECIAVL